MFHVEPFVHRPAIQGKGLWVNRRDEHLGLQFSQRHEDAPLVIGEDPFDYAAEDRLIDAWLDLKQKMPDWDGEQVPGYGMAYSGPGGRARSQATFEES